ncbi:MAG: T9SS type A sorting domain-containing protein [Bacteroidota bacterium]
MKKIVPIVLFLLFSAAAFGQNLVPNPGFEANGVLPDTIGQLFRASNWSNLNGGTDWPFATPDYFHKNGNGGTALPNTVFGDVDAVEGDACIGFITFNMFQPNFREYASVQLNQTMTPGIPYTISFFLTNGSGNYYGARATNNIGVAFTTGQPNQLQREVVPLNPQVEITAITHNSVWVQYTFTFTPTQPFTHMTIGNFRNDANTMSQIVTSGWAIAYYFMDMVNVSPTAPLPADQLALRQVSNKEAVVLEWNIPEVDGEGDWALERSKDRNVFTTVEAYQDAGSLMAGQTLQYEDRTAKPNVEYFYRLRRVSPNGETFHSDVLAASFSTDDLYTAGTLYPNPVQTEFTLEFATGEAGNLNLELLNLNGQVVFSEEKSITAGDLLLGYNVPETLANGLYHARFTFKGQRFVKKVVVQK